MASEIKVDTISEKTSANGITIDGVNIKDSALVTAGSVPLSTIDIDGGTDIGAAVVDADLFIIDDGAGGTNRKVTASRIKTYAGGSDPASADGDTLGTASLEWSDLYLADSSVIYFGNDQDTTLTHTDGTGLTLNSTNKLCFNDASQFVQGSSATVLSIGATDEIDLTATAVDLNGTLDVSGTTTLGGTLTVNAGAIFNEASADVDFRIESNGNANAIFVDAGNDRVGIGTGTVDTGGKCLTLKAMGSAGPQLILHQYNATDGWEFNAEDATGHLTIADSSAEEIFRFDDTGQLSSGGETAADVGAGGLCLDQNAIDTSIMTFKNSDVAHGMTGVAETDTYGAISKCLAAEGGLRVRGLSDASGASGLDLFGDMGGASNTGEATGSNGTIHIDGAIKSGTGRAAMGADENTICFRNAGTTEVIFKGDGEIFSNQSATVGTFDAYEDAQLVRAYDLSHMKGVIDSKFDKFVQYNQKDLLDARLIGKDEDGNPTSFVNWTGMSRLHNGAIWQQYEKHQQLLEAVYDLAKVAVGEEKANAILDKHEVKRLQ